jgi:serine/threonine protein kinase
MSETSASADGTPQERGSDAVFARLALERGLVTHEQIAEARQTQAKARDLGLVEPLRQILVVKGALDQDEAQELAAFVGVSTGEVRLIAGYEVVEKLGQGGMGAVYKARKSDTGQVVALKLLPPSLATDVNVARFRRESAVTAKLGHANIVGCVEFGRDAVKDVHFCALEFVEGEDVARRIERLGKIPEAEAVDITRQMAMALQHTHYNGLVHRDVKPANIMLTPDGTAKLLDLGLVRPADVEESRLTQAGVFVGSPHYVSPEQATGKETDTRGDIYSLGATLYHMLTGRPPYDGKSAMAILHMQVTEMLPWPADIVPELSDRVCMMVAKMMAKAPEDRYQIPKELLSDLDAPEEGEAFAVSEEVLRRSSIRPAVKPRARARRKKPPTQRRAESVAGATPGARKRPPTRTRGEPAAPRKRRSTHGRAQQAAVPEKDRPGSARYRAGTITRKTSGTGLESVVTYWSAMPQTTKIGAVVGAASLGVVLAILLVASGSNDGEDVARLSPLPVVVATPPVVRAVRPEANADRREAHPGSRGSAGPSRVDTPSAAVDAGRAIWIEGEAPSRHDFERHPWWYEQVDIARLSNQRWLGHFKDGDGTATAEYEFRVEEAGPYTLWLRCNVNSVLMAYRLDDGEWLPIPMDAPVDPIVLHHLLRTLAWVKVARVDLSGGSHRLSYRLSRNTTCPYPPAQNHGGIDCMCLAASALYVPSGAARPQGATVFADVIPAGWMQLDVGVVVTPGRARCSAGKYVITSSGFDGYGANFHYVYRKVGGNFRATVRVESLTQEKWNAFAALTVLDRASVDAATVKRVAIGMRHYGVAELFTGHADKSVASLKRKMPCWLKMERVGNTFSAYVGGSDKEWTKVGEADAVMPQEVCVGLSVGSSDFCEISTGVFDELIIYEE